LSFEPEEDGSVFRHDSQKLNKVFGLGSIECLLADITKDVDVDFVDLNLLSRKSWEIGVRKRA
jgi:hypothetical protein